MLYHHINIQIVTSHKAPYFLGSALRGAFGYALKKVVCINPSYQCDGCFARQECLYYSFYERQNSYHTYRFDLEGKGFDFSLFLFEESCQKLPYILSSLHSMLTTIGLTKANLTFDTIEMFVDNKLVYNKGIFNLTNTPTREFQPPTPNSTITINLITPLRIKKNNKFLRNNVDLEDILRSIYQKERELCYGEVYAKLNYTPSYNTISKQFHYKTIIRKSNRQKSKMNMDGIVGTIKIENLDPISYRLLKLGEILGVGKQTVMGLGKIEAKQYNK